MKSRSVSAAASRGLSFVACAIAAGACATSAADNSTPCESVAGAASCEIQAAAAPITLHYDFTAGELGWKAQFADYGPAQAPTMNFDSGARPLPPELGRPGTGYLIQATNRSDDVFMLLQRQLGASDGIAAGQRYTARYAITMASDAPAGCFGVGGAPGEGVTLKAGAADHEPQVKLDGEIFRVTIDKGNQTVGGKDMGVAGNIVNGGPSSECDQPVFRTFSRSYLHPTPVTASAAGSLWLLVGTDSGYEGLTRLYYEQIDVQLTPAP